MVKVVLLQMVVVSGAITGFGLMVTSAGLVLINEQEPDIAGKVTSQ